MKTETQIAKEILEQYNRERVIVNKVSKHTTVTIKFQAKEHKASCQRFLEFLQEESKRWETVQKIHKQIYISTGELEEKITDLKNAIKLCNEAGI